MRIFNIKNFLISGTMASLLMSCAVGKKYTRTDLQIPETYKESVQVTGDTVVLPWKTFFKDPKLIGLIDKALSRNNEVNVALKNIEQLDLIYKQAKLGLMPTLDITAGANRSWASKNTLNGSLNEQFVGTKYMDDFSAALRLSWEVDIWGKAKMQKESAAAEYFGQKENLNAIKSRIVVQVAQAYYNLISLDEQLKIAEQNIELSDNTLKMMNLQFTAGQINSLAVQQSEAQKKTAELLIPLAKQNISIQENALSILCGEYPAKIERQGDLKTMIPENKLSEGLPAQLLSRRPDLKMAEFNVISLNSKTGLAKAAMYPSISLSPQIGVNSNKFSSWFDIPGSITKAIAASLAAPIFQKKQLKTAYDTALIEQEKAAINFKQSVMTAVGEVSDAMAKSKSSSDRLQLLEQRTAILDKGINDALKLYKSGMATYLEVITAQNNKLQNDLEAINVTLEKLNAEVDLYRALGGGVQ
ncbi:NodT family efflux transporter outer membrane factor (OMF) lipoprotein [Chryseobacterium bernardetii]|uniref:NodT family efflux transporter outer membrane factor (OMF) lipoprotein n=2 Tax=Chryseobacterium TaxID=59732 RepID=A0A543EBL3_9FLAO|nr:MULTISPECIES: TolC family protein [Chryseobacterium]MDR6371392.1 NodT family efflux transporter outer membrane factor (OMF) lipoprotein [Chryseobacterium vietnamense]MDR6442103.1 NodT family efflux transporter outer membrane factor (OMF) lipoprotein [Chryseobacterium bernardetii]TQM18982.1 NodT family efflux transporter outer membrane factor (OMF) lipoprotein [Chryseobacterium aquifrigidense]